MAPNGIDLNEIPKERKNNFFNSFDNSKKINLIWIGVKRPDKNLLSLVHAVALLPENIRDLINIFILGPDNKNNEATLKELASSLDISKCFKFLPAVYGNDKYNALESADVHILPSKSEVFSLAMLDAMACSKPCLVSNGCGYEPWKSKDFYISFDPNPKEISESIVRMIARRSDWQIMGENARLVVEQELNWKKIASTMIKNYRRIIKS
jgi:glycosyltransferase involved in cell wall biosynthesis